MLISTLLIASRSDGSLKLTEQLNQEGFVSIGGLFGVRQDADLELIGSHAGGSISNESTANQTDPVGGLLGRHVSASSCELFQAVRFPLHSAALRWHPKAGSACAAGAGNDRVGALIGSYGTTANSIVQNNLAIGLTEGLTAGNGDSVGFFGYMFDNVDDGETAAEVTTALNAAFVGNYYDSAVTTLSNRMSAVLPTIAKVMALTRDVITNRAGHGRAISPASAPAAPPQLKVAAPDTGYGYCSHVSLTVGWDTTRWYFKDASSYPEPRYYDYDWDHDGNSGTAAISIDICEDITPTNDPEEDEGSPLKPDCGDKLSAFPREPATE